MSNAHLWPRCRCCLHSMRQPPHLRNAPLRVIRLYLAALAVCALTGAGRGQGSQQPCSDISEPELCFVTPGCTADQLTLNCRVLGCLDFYRPGDCEEGAGCEWDAAVGLCHTAGKPAQCLQYYDDKALCEQAEGCEFLADFFFCVDRGTDAPCAVVSEDTACRRRSQCDWVDFVCVDLGAPKQCSLFAVDACPKDRCVVDGFGDCSEPQVQVGSTAAPSGSPSHAPSPQPSTTVPSVDTAIPTRSPSRAPSPQPFVTKPSSAPIALPTAAPTTAGGSAVELSLIHI